MPKELRKDDICHNCQAHIGDYNYCPNCGQMNSHRQIHLKHIIKELIGDYFTFDNKFFKSFWPLVAKPGFLTKEYLSGRRAAYIFPLRLYIFTTFLFFLIVSISNKIDPYNIEEEQKRIVTEDSLYQFFEPYSESIPKNTQEKLIRDLGFNYEIKKRILTKTSSHVPDTLSQFLQISQPDLDDSSAAIYAKQIYFMFKFYKNNKREISTEDRAYFDSVLKDYKFSENSRKTFFNLLDSSYSYRKVIWKNDNINVVISGSNENAFLHKIEEKAMYLFNHGHEGWAIFWSELIRQVPKIMFFLLPLFALFLKLFYIRQKIFYINHLIFALHIHSLIFVYLIIAILFPNIWLILGIALATWLHIFVAFINVYRQKKILTFFKLNIILFLYLFVIMFAFGILSLFTIWVA
jgi:hypothetical protein